MKLKEFKVEPIGKPRMTQRDKWKKRECVERYFSFRDRVRLLSCGFKMPEAGYHLKFFIPMPLSWSKKKRSEMVGKPHQAKPDKDNLEKAFLDAVCVDDAYVWDGRVSKYWSNHGKITIEWGKHD